jgi:hypothetical protein
MLNLHEKFVIIHAKEKYIAFFIKITLLKRIFMYNEQYISLLYTYLCVI